jgi:DNA-binding NarL/FixJ family response regulator
MREVCGKVRIPLSEFRPRRPLTARQWEVVQGLADDKTYEEIADALRIAPRTVLAHVHAIALLLPGLSDPRDRVLRYAVIVAVEQEMRSRTPVAA